MSLYDALRAVKDPRRGQGLRNDLGKMFCMTIIANLCGYFGGRPVARFGKAYAKTFTDELNLKHPVPSHVTFTDLINRVDQGELIAAFNKWAEGYVPLEKDEMVSGDGKALGSTVTDQHGKGQDFQAIVSLFCQKSGLVRSIEQYRNAKDSEIDVVRFLVKKLKGMGVTIFLDALHTQKKQ